MGNLKYQTYWRIAGGVAISACAAMTFAARYLMEQISPMALLAYWVVWLLLLVFSLYVVLVDLRYLRVRFLAEERELFKETMGESAIRQAIIKAQQELQAKNSQPPSE